MDYNLGDLVWGKMKGFPYWPGIVKRPPEELKNKKCKPGYHCIYFFGTKNYAYLEETCLKKYEPTEDVKNSPKLPNLMKAIEEIEAFISNSKQKRKSSIKVQDYSKIEKYISHAESAQSVSSSKSKKILPSNTPSGHSKDVQKMVEPHITFRKMSNCKRSVSVSPFVQNNLKRSRFSSETQKTDFEEISNSLFQKTSTSVSSPEKNKINRSRSCSKTPRNYKKEIDRLVCKRTNSASSSAEIRTKRSRLSPETHKANNEEADNKLAIGRYTSVSSSEEFEPSFSKTRKTVSKKEINIPPSSERHFESSTYDEENTRLLPSTSLSEPPTIDVEHGSDIAKTKKIEPSNHILGFLGAGSWVKALSKILPIRVRSS